MALQRRKVVESDVLNTFIYYRYSYIIKCSFMPEWLGQTRNTASVRTDRRRLHRSSGENAPLVTRGKTGARQNIVLPAYYFANFVNNSFLQNILYHSFTFFVEQDTCSNEHGVCPMYL